ncbi:tissue factor-like [Aplochiton taeniatus]
MVCVGGVQQSEEFFPPRAQNINWLSINFKTLLVWRPIPSSYTYTVEFFEQDQDFRRSPNCIHSEETECDLTNELSPLDRTYSAIVQSEPLAEAKSDLVEFPFARSPYFNPYRDSHIGPAEFRLQLEEEGRTVRLIISDPMTPLYRDPDPMTSPYRDTDPMTTEPPTALLFWQGQLMTVRDILQNDLKYRIIYNKAGSTGKKEVVSEFSVVEIKTLDPEETYCFSIAAYVPSRPIASRLGDWSPLQCTPRGQTMLLQELNVGVMAGALLILSTLVIIMITLTVFCWRHYCTRSKTGPPTSPV